MAENLGSVNITIEPDLAGFRRSLERQTDKIELDLGISFSRTDFVREISAIEKTLDDVNVGLDIDRAGFLKKMRTTLAGAEKSLPDIDVGLEPGQGAISQLRTRASAAIKAVQASLPDLNVGMNVRAADAALAGLSTQAARVGTSLARMSAIGAGAGAAIAVGGVALGVNSLREFDAALTQSLAIVQDVTPEIRQSFKETAEEVARTTIFGTAEAAEAYFFLASAGLNVEQQLESLPAVARFAQAGMFDLALATDIATDAQSALGLKSDDTVVALENLNRIQDVLVKGNILANASVQQFGEALTNRAGAAARALGKDVEETTAVLAAFADQGTKGRRAGEEFARLLGQLSTLAVKNEGEFADLGVQVFDAAGEFRNSADVIAEFEDLLGGMSDEAQVAALEQLGLGEELRKTIQLVLGTSDSIRTYEAALRSAGGTTEQVAQAQLGSLDNQLKLIGTNINLVLQALGQPIADRLKVFFENGAEGFGTFFQQATAHATTAGELILVQMEKAFAFVRSADFATFLGSLQASFQTVVGGIKEFGSAFSDAFGADGGGQSFIVSLGQAFEGFATVLADILPLLGRISGTIAGFVSENTELVGIFAKLLVVLSLVGGAFRIFKIFAGPIKLIVSIVSKLIPVFGFIGRLAGSMIVFLGRWIPILSRIGFFLLRFSTPLGIVVSIVAAILLKVDFVRDAVKALAGLVKDGLSAAFDFAKEHAELFFGPLGSAIGLVKDAFGGLGDEAETTAERIGFSLQPIIGIAEDTQARLQQLIADAKVDEAIKDNISGAQVEALKRNKRLAEQSSADINEAFKRIGRVAVSDGFRESLRAKLDGIRERVLRERIVINRNFERIGNVETSARFVTTFIAAQAQILKNSGLFSVTVSNIISALMHNIQAVTRDGLRMFVDIIRNGLQRSSGVFRAGLANLNSIARGFVPTFTQAGRGVIRGFQDGLEFEWAFTEEWLSQRTAIIQQLKGPLPYDRTILFEAGRAVMSGFQRGLDTGWSPVESWLSSRGQLMKGIVSADDVVSLSADILLGNVANPAEALTGLEPDVPRFWTSFADMMEQAKQISRMFNVAITSSFRDLATNIAVGGAPNSLHTKGRAVDFGGGTGNLDALAAWAEEFNKFFQEILWRVAGHFDHVHLGWATGFPKRRIGGGTQPGQTYLVGENGPELWTAPARGVVHNTYQTKRIQQQGTGGGYSPTYQVQANGLGVDAVEALIAMRERRVLARMTS
jgi:TP901 family phage tail tape measure protein